jgi:negative regulator of sigma E activity
MSEEMLSALLDGECTPAEVEALLAEIDRSPTLKARWSRMCATRDALAGTAIRHQSLDLTASIMAALDDAPEAAVNPKVVPLRPRAVAVPAPQPAVAGADRAAARSLRRSRIAGLAVAASITAVVAIGGRSLLEAPVDAAVASRDAVVAAAPVADPNIVKVSANGEISGATADAGAAYWTQVDAETAHQLNGYLLEHNTRTGSGMGGALGYARIAVRSTDFRPAAGSR